MALRKRVSARLLEKLHKYLLELQPEVLPKSPSGAAVRYALNQWTALTRFLEDGELEIDNGATERANRDIAVGRGNWTFFGSDQGGKTAAVLRSFVASVGGGQGATTFGSHLASLHGTAFPSLEMLAEQSSPSRVRCAAPNNGAPLTAPGRS